MNNEKHTLFKTVALLYNLFRSGRSLLRSDETTLFALLSERAQQTRVK